ncbi:Dual specificity tyrosine-phosphorylation-regulated kinase 3 [Metarhizium anisopliae]
MFHLSKNSADTSAPRYIAVKIAALDIDAAWEAGISELIANAEPSHEAHEGLDFIQTHIDEFQLTGENWTNTLRSSVYHEANYGLSDIKDDNSMVTIESEDILTNFIRRQTKNPQPKHIRIQDGRETYLSQGNFGLSQGSGLLPKVAGFNFAFPGLANGNGHLFAIQSHRFRTPEVILGCPWSYSVDVWNLGLLNLMEGIGLFNRPAGEDGEYDAHVHLAQMVSLLGEPDEECIKRERFFRNY